MHSAKGHHPIEKQKLQNMWKECNLSYENEPIWARLL